MPKIIEKGNIFFLFRPKVEAKKPEEIERFYMVLKPDEGNYRVYVIGSQHLPEVTKGQFSKRRVWALTRTITKNPQDIAMQFSGGTYDTATKGERHLPAAAPAGEGKYALVIHKDHIELVYLLKLPKEEGLPQELLEIKEEASYIVSVKNPNIKTKGFPSGNVDYPKEMLDMFADRRWIPIETKKFLDYEGVQLLLIGAHEQKALEELGIKLEPEKMARDEVFSSLRLDREKTPVEPLFKAEFPPIETFKESKEKKEIRFGARSG